ncbi:MAG TPA: biotin--[acetyl-CoA-carboxylase] ligase, partial [Actinomycetota bacterium]|nr:biotin--[acetyl-CoA-carboxylase] ligase [Actinomycetota bacterium]
GILSVRDGDSAIVGMGINLGFGGDRPDPNAVSVAEIGGDPDADALAATVVGNLHGWWTRFVEAAGDARRCGLYDAYAGQCVTLGRDVGVSAPGGSYNGHAQGIDEHGRLLVDVQAATRAVDAADVTLA